MDVHAAALNGDVESISQYLAESGNPNVLNEAGITPLHSAAVQGQAEVIRLLIAAGADADLKVCRGKEGVAHDASPLLLAVLGGHLEAARVLLEGGAEVGAKNAKGLTPLHVSCLKPHSRMVSLLLLWGADTNARDRKKRTPEQVVGRLERDPVEEKAVRAVLSQAAAARVSALAANANTGQMDKEEGNGASRTPASATSVVSTPFDARDASYAGAHPNSSADGADTSVATDGNATHTGNAATAVQPPFLPPPPSLKTIQIPQNGKQESPPLPPSTTDTLPTDTNAASIGMAPIGPPVVLAPSIHGVYDEVPHMRTVIMPARGDEQVSMAVASELGPRVAEAREMRTALVEGFSHGVVLAGQYELEKAMPSSSGSSDLWFATKSFTGEEVVIKRVSAGREAAFERERAVLKFLQGQGFKAATQHSIPLVDVIPKLRCLVLGRGGRTLRQIGRKYYQKYSGNAAGYMDRARPYARQVVEICQWLHRFGVVWGDAKPENFVEGQDGDLRAIDFDSACFVSGGVASSDEDIASRVGGYFDADHVLTPRYCAPERAQASLCGEPCLATRAVDVWSAGMVLFWLLTGQDYFEEGLPDEDVVKRLCSLGFKVSLASVDPKQEQARNLLQTMLSQDPSERGTMDSVLGRAFFAGGASITASRMRAEMAASLGGVSMHLESTIRNEGDSTRSLLSESMSRVEARADEMLKKLGRLDRMLDHVVDGSTDCPRLFILTPATGSQKLWKPDTWFSDHNLLTFLCAYDLAPVGEAITVPCPRSSLEKWAPAIQASAFVIKLGSKAACMTAGVAPSVIDGMSAALGVNFLAGQKVSAALRSAAGKALGDPDNDKDESENDPRCGGGDGDGRESAGQRKEASESDDVKEGRRLTGEAYQSLVSFLDENEPSWRASLRASMTKAVRADGEVSWTCHEHVWAWRNRSGALPAASRSEGPEEQTGDPAEIGNKSSLVDPPSQSVPGAAGAGSSAGGAVDSHGPVAFSHCKAGIDYSGDNLGSKEATSGGAASKIHDKKSERLANSGGSKKLGGRVGMMAKIKARFGRRAG